jgi:hypothetical protein
MCAKFANMLEFPRGSSSKVKFLEMCQWMFRRRLSRQHKYSTYCFNKTILMVFHSLRRSFFSPTHLTGSLLSLFFTFFRRVSFTLQPNFYDSLDRDRRQKFMWQWKRKLLTSYRRGVGRGQFVKNWCGNFEGLDHYSRPYLYRVVQYAGPSQMSSSSCLFDEDVNDGLYRRYKPAI